MIHAYRNLSIKCLESVCSITDVIALSTNIWIGRLDQSSRTVTSSLAISIFIPGCFVRSIVRFSVILLTHGSCRRVEYTSRIAESKITDFMCLHCRLPDRCTVKVRLNVRSDTLRPMRYDANFEK